MKNIVNIYIDPLTDFGMKKLFGNESVKHLLVDFLNAVFLSSGEQINSITYLKNEQLDLETDRKSLFDIYCRTSDDKYFLIELQNSIQHNIKERMLYYTTYPIRTQADRGDQYSYELNHVYSIAIINFRLNKQALYSGDFLQEAQLVNVKTGEIYYDKLTFFLLELRNFRKGLHELSTRRDKWIYLLKKLKTLDRVPKIFNEEIFMDLFEKAKIAKFTEDEYWAYAAEMKEIRDRHNEKAYYTEMIDKLKGKAEALEGETQTLESKTKTLETKAKTLESKAKTLETKTKTLETKTKTLESENKTLESKAKTFEKETRTLKDRTRALSSENKMLQLKLNEAKDAEARLKREEKSQIAAKLLKANMNIQQVSELTGLSIESVKLLESEI